MLPSALLSHTALLPLLLLCFMGRAVSSPLKVFLKGYNSRNLPPGGWTHWFNVDHPGGTGDFETYTNVVRMYGRTCLGVPCRRPLAVKAVSVMGRTPNANGDRVTVHPRDGLKCHSSHQQSQRCQDYKVRFYCQNLHTKCSASRFYPHHHRHHINRTSVQLQARNQPEEPPSDQWLGQKGITGNQPQRPSDLRPSQKSNKKMAEKFLKLRTKWAAILGTNEVKKPLRRSRTLKRKKLKSRRGWKGSKPATTSPATTSVVLNTPNAKSQWRTGLTYHPRHPIYA